MRHVMNRYYASSVFGYRIIMIMLAFCCGMCCGYKEATRELVFTHNFVPIYMLLKSLLSRSTTYNAPHSEKKAKVNLNDEPPSVQHRSCDLPVIRQDVEADLQPPI